MLSLTHYRSKKPYQNMARGLTTLSTPGIDSLQTTILNKRSSTFVTLKHIFKNMCPFPIAAKSSKRLCLITVKVAMSVFWSCVVAPNKVHQYATATSWPSPDSLKRGFATGCSCARRYVPPPQTRCSCVYKRSSN